VEGVAAGVEVHHSEVAGAVEVVEAVEAGGPRRQN
jgi:hypothetical protein